MIPQQTTYSRDYNDRVVGQPGDSGFQKRASKLNNEGAALPAGVAVTENAEGKCDLVDASTDKIAGIVINDYSRDPNGLSGSADAYADAKMFPMLEEGSIMVVVDQTVAVGDDVYVRHTANGSGKLQLGAFRKDADGVADVWTLTPTAANSTLYAVRVKLADATSYTFLYNSDGSATATEICDGIRTAMAADAAFAAKVTTSGTSTLILTGATSGEAMIPTSVGPGAFASITNTTPAAPHARKVKGAFWLAGGTSSSGKAELHFSRSTEWA
jgi:hypothetical protein